MNYDPENNPEDKPVNRDLYFLPILARAFQQPDRVEALKRAFAEIDALGREDVYRHGHEQFQQFMAEAVTRQVPDLLVEKEGQVIARIDPSHAAGEGIVPQITPGRYAVRLSTGRLLWTDELDAADLFWSRAFPGVPLRMAADSTEAPARCSRELRLLGEEVILRVYPGVESGTIGIRIRWDESHRSR